MAKVKPKYKGKSLAGAQRRVRELMGIVDQYRNIVDRLESERKLLAKLAATGPAFLNPLQAFAAEKLRDEILAKMGMNPDGTFNGGCGNG